MAPLNPRTGRPRQALKAKVYARDTHCHLCQLPLRMDLRGTTHQLAPSVDEIIPVSKGGDTLDLNNCRAACRVCNSSRGNRDLTAEVYARCRTLSLRHRNSPLVRPW